MFTNAKNPRWDSPAHEKIILDVQFINEDDYVAFIASPDDCTTHGPMLFNFARNGLFGEVMPSDEERIISGELPVPDGYAIQDGKLVYLAAYEQQATEELSRRLAELNTEKAKALAEIDEEYAAERKAQMSALLAVEKQSGWPVAVEWPEKQRK